VNTCREGRKFSKITVFWDMMLCNHRYVLAFWRNLLPLMKFTLFYLPIHAATSQKTTVSILTASRTSDLTNRVDHLVIGFALGDLCSILCHGNARAHRHA
jgi:hypothetical protein